MSSFSGRKITTSPVRLTLAALAWTCLAAIASCATRPAPDDQAPELPADEKPQSPPSAVDAATVRLEIDYYEGGGISGATLHDVRLLHNVEEDNDGPGKAINIDDATSAAVIDLLRRRKFWNTASQVNPNAMDMICHTLRVRVNDQVHTVVMETGSTGDDTTVDNLANEILGLIAPGCPHSSPHPSGPARHCLDRWVDHRRTRCWPGQIRV